MKHSILNQMTLTTFALLFSITGSMKVAHAADQRVEIALQNVFAPIDGYDDNDNVEVVLHGALPNSCYTVADSFYELLDDGVTVAIHQYATRTTDGICADDSKLPEHLAMIIPFNKELSIGRYNAFGYSLQFKTASGLQTRPLHISIAQAPTIDNLPYAIVSNVATADIVNGLDPVQVTLTGVLNSTCTALNDDIKIIKQGDVFVVLPTIRVIPGVKCAQILLPYKRKVNLGRALPGDYLVHVRSMNGHSVNRVIEVSR